jgi:hypothetical protein
MSKIIFTELTTNPPPPSVDQLTLFAKTDNNLYVENSAGVVVQISEVAAITTITGDVETISVIGGDADVEVLRAPLLTTSEVSGQILVSTTLVAMRYAQASDVGYTAGQVWLADNNYTTYNNFCVIGLAYPAATVIVGGAVQVTEEGLINVPSHGFTPGTSIYLGSSGAVTGTAPVAAGTAIVKLGQVKDANNIYVDIEIIGRN